MAHISRVILIITSLLVSVVFISCSKHENVETGVSWKLAQMRSANIKNVHYDLEFNIPELLDSVVRAKEILSFNYLSDNDLQIDFKIDRIEQIIDVKLFGEPVKWYYRNEHIVILGAILYVAHVVFDSMQNAGLLYGNIIYDKALVMMRNLEEMMGSERFRAAIVRTQKLGGVADSHGFLER